MSEKLETTPPLSEEGYVRTFAVYAENVTQYSVMGKIARTVITESNFDKEPVQMLSIGAGTGRFELQLVRDLGLKLEYICAIEPNTVHVVALETALISLGVEYDINKSFFNKEFEFDEKCGSANRKFDFILFSHSLYGIDDPCEAVIHATKFLKPTGKMLIINHNEISSADLFTYLVNKSDPNIFSADKTYVDHSLTAEKIISHLQGECPDLQISVVDGLCYLDVDSFVRKTGESGNDTGISFYLQAEYKDLSREAQDHIYEIVASESELIDGKYHRREACVGIVLSSSV